MKRKQRTRNVLRGWMLAAGLAVWAGCGSEGPPDSTRSAELPVGPAGERSFRVNGVVRDLPEEGGTVVVRHEEIPGYMPRMTMELTVLDTNELAGVQVGDRIEFRLVARADDHYIDGIRRTGSATNQAVQGAAEPGATEDAGSEEGAMLAPGDLVPDVGVRLETGEEVRLSKWRGNAMALTFFFTRCPLPDFCPRMNRNFQDARALLRAREQGPTNWVFLSLSFDWDFDQPKVLKGHADLYRGSDAEGWWFGGLGASGVAAVKPAFDLMIGRDGGSFSHNLRTVVVDPEGRVFRQFDGNRWTAEELAAAMAAACRPSEPRPPADPVP